MSDTRYKVNLENIFEGPKDLLIHLIKKNEVDIYDIPIAKITDQFLCYLEWMKRMNIDVAGDFILMAATLTQVKSRMLLPSPSNDDPEDDDDPRMEIARPLLEYLQIKSAAEQLGDRSLLGADTFARVPTTDERRGAGPEPLVKIGLFELIDAFQKILEKTPGHYKIDFQSERISLKDKMTEIIDIFETKASVAFDEMVSQNSAKSDVVITFLAILEMVKMGLLTVAQNSQTGVMRLFYI